MSLWVKAEFKGEAVWAAAAEDGTLQPKDGFVAICYREGGKAYKTRPERLEVKDPAPISFDQATSPAPEPAIHSASIHGLKGQEVVIQLWTDGACSGNPGPAGLGVLIRYKDYEKEISEFLGDGTNNIAELSAILRGLQAVSSPEIPVQVITDSSYSIGLLSKGWKPKANKELVHALRQELKRFKDVTFVKVKGHAGIEGNERADELARRAIEENL